MPTATFTASACEGTDTADIVPGSNELVIDGQRLENYNDGNVVPLYNNGYVDGRSVVAPVCGVREVDGVGPRSEWMYCTDIDLDTCDEVNGGRPGYTPEGDRHNELSFETVGPTIPVAGNDRLNDDQELVISYLLQNPHPFTALTPNGVADDSTDNNRVNRQLLVWCISDWEGGRHQFGDGTEMVDCDADLGSAEQSRILEIMKAEPILGIELTRPTAGTVANGDKATFTVSTNLYGKRLTVNVPTGAKVELCEPSSNAKLTGNTLVVTGSGNDSTDVKLCVTSPAGGNVKVSVSGTPSSHESIHWNNAGAECQVFATFDTVQQDKLAGDATVTFDTTTAPTTTTTAPTTAPTTTTTVRTTTVTVPGVTQPNVVVIPIIPIIPIIPALPGAPVSPGAPNVPAPVAPQVDAPSIPRAPTGPRPTAIDGGGADESAGPNLALTLGGLGLIGLAACGAIAVRRNRA
ncbi:hypothetical protein B2J88_29845 [Rhodococcus sp. SRB_17]|nr:hypothetical protein [Rhodococcus sp. SRB_17]